MVPERRESEPMTSSEASRARVAARPSRNAEFRSQLGVGDTTDAVGCRTA